MNLAKRIQHAIAQSGASQVAIAKKCGISSSAVSQWVHGATSNLKAAHAFHIADVTGFSARWLALNEGPQKEQNVAPQALDSVADGSERLEEIVLLLQRIERKLDAPGYAARAEHFQPGATKPQLRQVKEPGPASTKAKTKTSKKKPKS